MAYRALYRTYRPQLFREVVGQEVIVKSLQNAFANNKISHAYLFSGPRGTGKTTIARIFAKALNCENLTMLEPCDKCRSCHEIADSISPDVIEIDAASNNGVDEIRDIREKVKFLPSGSKYKVYIIDEVHMLSTGAFNALLKTLEEPPKHAIFILATTEPQKLPPTIISRCQRFDFKSLTVKEISKRLRLVCEEENVEISEEAVNAISESAEGALRDALSTLDQAISYSDEVVTIEDVNVVTGNLSYDMLIDIATFFHEGQVTEALEIVNDLIDMGKEVNRIVSGLLQFYRDMLLFQNVTEDSVMYYKYIFNKDSFKNLANSIPQQKIFYYLDVLSELQLQIKYSTTPRIYLEIAIVKMINNSDQESDYKARIEKLEKQIHENNNLGGEGVISNEKVDLLEVKLNQVVSEFHKLDLHKITQEIEKLKGEENKNADFTENKEFNERLEALEKQNFNKHNNQISYLEEDINNLKLAITEIKNKQFDLQGTSSDASNINEIKEKIISIEKKVYALLSGKLEEKETSKLKKKHPDQIVLFSDDLTPMEELESDKVEVDFDEFAKEEDDEEKVVEEKPEEIKETKIDIEENKEDAYEKAPVINKAPEEKAEKTNYKKEKQEAVETSSEGRLKAEDEMLGVIRNKISPHSQVVVTDSSNIDIFKREKELMEKEISRVKPSYLEKQEEVKANNEEPDNANNQQQRVEKEEIDRFSSYDIKIIETILHESFKVDARNDMKRINEIWPYLDRSATADDLGIAETLKEGKIVAVGVKEFIITYNTATLCNQVMRIAFKRRAFDIFEKSLGDRYNYIALPEKIWLEKRQEYVNQYTIGTKYPKLSPINDPDLVITKTEYRDPKDKTINKIISTFGDDIVKVE